MSIGNKVRSSGQERVTDNLSEEEDIYFFVYGCFIVFIAYIIVYTSQDETLDYTGAKGLTRKGFFSE